MQRSCDRCKGEGRGGEGVSNSHMTVGGRGGGGVGWEGVRWIKMICIQI